MLKPSGGFLKKLFDPKKMRKAPSSDVKTEKPVAVGSSIGSSTFGKAAASDKKSKGIFCRMREA